MNAIALIASSIMLMSQDLRPPKRWIDELHSVSPLFKNDTVEICFLGDIMMHSMQIEEALQTSGEYDFTSYFRLIKDKILAADVAVANMEFALGGEPYSGYPAFSAPDELAEYVASCGIDIFLCANNHIFDKGLSGARRTLDIYRELNKSYGTVYTGLAYDSEDEKHNHPLMLAVKGIRIAMINFTYGTNGGERNSWPKVNYMKDKADIQLAIETANRKHTDITIALPHWGNEYELRHSVYQEEMAQWLCDNGADLIIGSHPHVVQDSGRMFNKNSGQEVSVAYSLGNAVSNMSAKNTQIGLLGSIKIVRDKRGNIKLLPIDFSFLWCSRPGGFDDRYTVIPVEEYLGKAELWKNEWDYYNMVNTYNRVKDITGIE